MSTKLLVKVVIGLVMLGLVGIPGYAVARAKVDEIATLADAAKNRMEQKAQQVISVHFENAHIRSVLRYLSKKGGVNIVLDERVFSEDRKVIEGVISPRIRIDVEDLPLIEVLTVILRAKRLIYRIEENLIWITTPERMVLKGTTRVEKETEAPISAEELSLRKRARQLISLDFEDAHLRTVLRQLMKISGINIVLDESVFPSDEDSRARVTIRLEDIPLTEALDVILRSKGLKYQIHPNLIWVATSERMRKLREMEKLGEKIKEAQGEVDPELKEKVQQIVSLRFENAHIKNVLKSLSEISAINIVLDKEVFPEGTEVLEGQASPLVTIELFDLPLIQALTVILRPKELVYRMQEDCIWITTPEKIGEASKGCVFRLIGIISSGGKARVVQIENTRTGNVLFRRAGDWICDTFKVERIENRRVVLSKEGEENIILRFGKN